MENKTHQFTAKEVFDAALLLFGSILELLIR